MFSVYSLKARVFPTVITAIPILFLQYSFLDEEFSEFLSFLGSIEILGSFTISVVVVYFVSHMIRFISKTFFETEESFMPTTDFLLFKNTEYSEEYKKLIYKKISDDFGLVLPSFLDQKNDELNSRKRISEGVSLVRKKVGKGKLLLQHNIEYGFWRNLSGGSILALIFSLLLAYLSFMDTDWVMFGFSLVLSSVFLLILIFHKHLIRKVGSLYARVLIQEYMEAN